LLLRVHLVLFMVVVTCVSSVDVVDLRVVLLYVQQNSRLRLFPFQKLDFFCANALLDLFL
jgi:hypothetical protein